MMKNALRLWGQLSYAIIFDFGDREGKSPWVRHSERDEGLKPKSFTDLTLFPHPATVPETLVGTAVFIKQDRDRFEN